MENQNASEQSLPWLFRPGYDLLVALQFLTIAPSPLRRPVTSADLGRAVGYFPLVGAILGGLLVALDRLLATILPLEVSTVALLATAAILTGALHLDGFLDSCDGLLGGHTPEARLAIMRDERVGGFGVAGGILLLFFKYVALVSTWHRAPALLLAPVLGRWGMALAVVGFPYARPEGLGRAMKEHAGWGQVLLATAIALAVSGIAGGVLGLAAVLLAAAATWALARFILARLPGLTGDTYGAICEVLEVLVLLLFAVRV